LKNTLLVTLCLTLGASFLTARADEQAVIQLQAAMWAGRIIQDTPSLSCDVDLCTREPEAGYLRSVINLKAGVVLRAEDLKSAWSRLIRTGYFREVRPKFVVGQKPGSPVKIEFVCTGHVVITDLEIEYADWQSWIYPKQFVAEIRKRLPLRRGGSFPLRRADGTFAPKDADLLTQYQNRIVNLYTQQGYLGTEVQIIPTYHGANGKRASIVVRVKEGAQPELGQVLVRGAVAFPYWRIVEPLATGERADFWRPLFGLFGVGRYERKQLKEDLKQVETSYREAGWVAARVRLESEVVRKEGRVYPRVRVIEGRHLEVRFKGNRKISDGVLERALTFKESGTFDDTEIEESKRKIAEAYQALAHYYVQVTAKKVRLKEQHYRITFTINEGQRVYVRRVEIVGNHRVSRRALESVMETQGVADDGVLNALTLSSGIVQHARIVNDLNALRNVYQQRGMPAMQFRCAGGDLSPGEWSAMRQQKRLSDNEMGPNIAPEFFAGKFDIWSANPLTHHCYEIIPDEDPRLVILRVELNEGYQSKITQVNLRSVVSMMDDQMQDEARLLLEKQGFIDEYGNWRANVGFNRSRLRAVRGFILRYLHQEGYLSASVNAVCEVSIAGVLTEQECNEDTLYGRTVDRVSFDLKRGPRTKVSGILIRGNLTTKNKIVLNELLMKPGEPLGSDELFLSQANLRSLGVFDAVNMQYIGHDTGTGREVITKAPDETKTEREATVVVTVEETQAKLLDLYFGLQIDSTATDDEIPVLYNLETTVRHRNLLGYALEIGLGANHSNRLDAPTDIKGDDAVWRAGPFFKNRRFLGTRLDLAIESLYERSQTAQRDAYQDVFNVDATIGFDFYNLSYPSRWGQGLRMAVSTEFRRERLRPLTRQDERPQFADPTNSISLSPNITWDRRDSPLHPTRGWLVIAQAELLFPELTALDDLPFKTTLTSQYVQSFFKRGLIIVPNFRIGSVWTTRAENDLKSGFLFKAGGDGVTLPVRGYEDAAIDACQASEEGGFGDFCEDVFPPGVTATDDLVAPATIGGRAMMIGGLELRFPTFILDDFWFTAFTDFGAIAPRWQDMTADRIKSSVGGGLRWLLSGQIPLRLDVAYPLGKTPFGAQDVRVHLNIFYTL
jgi:outer membrane protein assembly factor BamA